MPLGTNSGVPSICQDRSVERQLWSAVLVSACQIRVAQGLYSGEGLAERLSGIMEMPNAEHIVAEEAGAPACVTVPGPVSALIALHLHALHLVPRGAGVSVTLAERGRFLSSLIGTG